MKKLLILVVICFAMVGCVYDSYSGSAARTEHQQQERGVSSIIANQPVPDLGGYSFERQVVIDTTVARNKGTISTYSYTLTLDGKIIEICASKGFPIPYSTQLTNPTQLQAYNSSWGTTIGNPEPNGLYPPASANATFVNCVNSDGSVTPTYWEQDVFALPYRVKSDLQIQKVDKAEPTFKISK